MLRQVTAGQLADGDVFEFPESKGEKHTMVRAKHGWQYAVNNSTGEDWFPDVPPTEVVYKDEGPREVL